MRVDFHVGGRLVSCLDSAAARPGLAQDAVPATLLLLHAFPLNASMWEAQVNSTPPGWRFLAPDMRGCGGSAPDDRLDSTLSLDDYAHDVLALLDHLRVRRAVVAGLSMGGYAAFALLRLAPERIAGLVLCNTKAEADSEEAKSGRRDMLRLLDREGLTGVTSALTPRLLGVATRTARPQVEESVRDIAGRNDPQGVRAAIIRMMNRPDSTGLLPVITCPTLVVASEEDVVTPANQARAMQQAIPGSDLAMIRRAGHLSNLEQPGEFAAVLHRFLSARFPD
jgi:pimeloyl-ACP methyl ester carboxylesterase